MPRKYIDLTGQHIEEWEILSYSGNGYWNCRCSCGAEKRVRGYELRAHKIKSCGHIHNFSNRFKDLTGQIIDDLKILKYLGNQQWECECICGETKILESWDLRNKSHICNHSKLSHPEILNTVINSWTVLEYKSNNQYLCRCSCGNFRLVNYNHLINGNSKSCGHNKVIDLKGLVFGELRPVVYIGNSLWECQCSCGNKVQVKSHNLRAGITKSCGCKSLDYFKSTMIDKYGVESFAKANGRSDRQLSMLDSEDKFKQAIIDNFEHRPTSFELSQLLGINEQNTLKYIHKYNAEYLVKLGGNWTSSYELEILQLFPGGIQSDRSILHGKELDILYKDYNLAIEFNGSYWHSDLFKSKSYHQDKSLSALNNNIKLIHIFEYEWEDLSLKLKIIDMLGRILDISRYQTYSLDDCVIQEILEEDAISFIVDNALTNKFGNIHIGLIADNQLLGLISMNRSDDIYNIINIAWKIGVNIDNGFTGLFRYIIKNFDTNIISIDLDFSKSFLYGIESCGFEIIDYTNPTYVSWDTNKNRLVDVDDLEYLRIYNCGIVRYLWKSKEENV